MIENESNMLRVILCKPGECAEVVEIHDDLSEMQELVGGLIEEYMPFHSDDAREDDLAIVCCEEGKMNGMKPCRAVADEVGHVMDVIAGPFFICYAPIESETFQSLPPDLEEKYRRKFELPERFFKSERGISVVRYEPDNMVRESAQER